MAAPPTDHTTIARGISATFPDLGNVIVGKTLGVGFNSIAVEADACLVFRIARTAGTANRFAMETRLLPILSDRLAVAVPEPKWFSATSEHFPLGVIGYEKIEGMTLKPELLRGSDGSIAAQIADVMLALHETPLDIVAGLGLPQPEDFPPKYRALADVVLPVLEERMTPLEFERLDRWWETFLGDERMTQFEPALTHGDFWFQNMIVDNELRLAGVVDWEHAAFGDRAQDVATLLHLGRDFAAETLRAYRERGGVFDDDDEYRMERLWELRDFYGVLYGIHFDDEEELRDSIRKLRDGPLLTASEAS